MALLQLSNIVGNPSATTPESMHVSLSSKNVVVESFGSNEKYVAFNNAPVALTNNFQTISANNTKLRIDTAYNGVNFAVINNNGSSSTFTALTGTTGAASRNIYLAQSTNYNAFDTVTSEKSRLWNLNG